MAMRLKAHPVLAILPPLTKLEIDRAAERVRLYGQTQAVETVAGKVVNGLEEYEGCLLAGTKPKVKAVKVPEGDLIEYVIRRLPRSLTSLDRAVIAVLAEEQWKLIGLRRMREAGRIGGKMKGKGPCMVPEPFGHQEWFAVAARVVGTTPGAVKRLATLRRAAPDVFDAVRSRKLTILRDARDLAHALKSPKARAKVLALRTKNPGVPVGRLVADVMREQRPAISGSPVERGDRWVVYEGPLVREGKRISDASIDLVHADIIYGDASMAEDVAKLAKRVLVEDGLLALIGGHNVLDIMNAIAKHLVPIAIGSYHVKNNTKRRWTGPVQRVDALPVLVFGRQKVRQIDHLAFVSDLKDENWHGWQKNVTATVDLIRAMTPPGSRVLDPCLGSGTTGVAAIECGCSFVGIDVDRSAVKTARARLAEAERRLGSGLERPRVA